MIDATKVNEAERHTRTSHVVQIPIGANSMASLPYYGEAFYFVGLTAEVWLRAGEGRFKPYRKGTGERLPEDQRFSRLEIENRNAFPVLVRIWIGFGEYTDNRFEVVDSFSDIIGSGTEILEPAESVDLVGYRQGDEIQRKAVYVSVLTPGGRLDLYDQDNNLILYVFGETSIQLPIAGFVRVKNNTAGNIACAISESWYRENRN